jgi:hypothetical protein
VLVTFLRANVDVFAWQPLQMPGIAREMIEHHLKFYPDARPVQQRPRKQSVERQNFIREDVKKLLDIAATSEAMSMVLVAERPDPHAPHELGSSSVDGSGSLDPRPAEEPGAASGSGSQDS